MVLDLGEERMGVLLFWRGTEVWRGHWRANASVPMFYIRLAHQVVRVHVVPSLLDVGPHLDGGIWSLKEDMNAWSIYEWREVHGWIWTRLTYVRFFVCLTAPARFAVFYVKNRNHHMYWVFDDTGNSILPQINNCHDSLYCDTHYSDLGEKNLAAGFEPAPSRRNRLRIC
jgi:hypothetical protein